jgi:hypothetical protein
MNVKTALGFLTTEQLSIVVGNKTVHQRLNVVQGGEIILIRGKVSDVNGVSLYDLIFGESDIVNETTFQNISNRLVIPKRYQRNFVKDLQGKQSIMRAIFKGQLTNPLYFSFVKNKNILEIVDGQQRWVTLKKFVDNEFPLGKNTIIMGKNRMMIDVSGLTYNQIKNELPNGEEIIDNIFESIYLPVIFYQGTEEQIRELFKELNTGASGLNKIEILLATESTLFSQVRDWNNEIPFDIVGIETTRFTAAELILKLYDYFLNGPKKVTKKDLENLANKSVDSKFVKTISDVKTFIKTIPETAIKEYGKGTIRLLMYFLIDLRKEWDVQITDPQKFFLFVNKMFKTIMKLKGKVTVGTKDVYWFIDMVRRDDKDVIISLTNECDLFLQMMLKTFGGDLEKFNEETGIQFRELNRNINKVQRWEVLLNQDSICPHCGEVVFLGDDAHHIHHYSKGGPNEVTNMVIYHKECHKEVHKNDKLSQEELQEDIDLLEDYTA